MGFNGLAGWFCRCNTLFQYNEGFFGLREMGVRNEIGWYMKASSRS